MDILEKIQKIAEEVGFDLVGIVNIATSDERLATSNNKIASSSASWRTPRNDNAGAMIGGKLEKWVENGYHAEMKWFAETVEKRKNILKVMLDAKSVICVAINYYDKDNSTSLRYSEDLLNSDNFGKIAGYAYGRDYHKIFDKKLKLFVKRLEEEIIRSSQDDKQNDKDWIPASAGMTDIKFKYYCDTGPVLERAWAVKAGMGFIGKNTNLITKYGSWVLLGEIVANGEFSRSLKQCFEEHPQENLLGVLQYNFQTVKQIFRGRTSGATGSRVSVSEKYCFDERQQTSNCGSCRRCLDACPTGALCAPYTVDARKCISYLTIEYKGEIPVELREKMGNRIFGCDACQEICPFNIGQSAVAKAMADKAKEKNELTEKPIAGSVRDLKEILSIKTDEEFLEKFAGSPIMRAKRRGLVRNACIAAGNSKDKTLLPCLKDCLNDSEPIIVSHAKWAIGKLKAKNAKFKITTQN